MTSERTCTEIVGGRPTSDGFVTLSYCGETLVDDEKSPCARCEHALGDMSYVAHGKHICWPCRAAHPYRASAKCCLVHGAMTHA